MFFSRIVRIGLLATMVAAVAAAAGFSQILLQNEDYQRALELREEARSAFEEGDYDLSIELSREASEHQARARETAAHTLHGFRAASARNRARERMEEVELLGIADAMPDVHEEARSLLDQTESSYNNEEFDRTIDTANQLLDLLDGDLVAELRAIAREPDEDVEDPDEEDPPLPAEYQVRLIPERRDSFWRIAEYPWIYDDPWKWTVLYEANRDVLRNPDNPDLIHPGMVFEIPSIEGEEREGRWDPEEWGEDPGEEY